jgi:integrase
LSSSGKRLTETFVESLELDGRDRIIFDSLQPGFGVRVTPVGRKIYIAQARARGRPRRISIGTHPEKSVADARREARGVLEDLRAGRDPRLEQLARQKAAHAGKTTVAALADRWMAQYVTIKLKPRTTADYRTILEQRIRPQLGHLIVEQVTRDDVVTFHAGMSRTPRRANYVVATFRALMTFAEDCGLRPPMSNPARRIKMYREGLRERFLSEEEIGRAAEAIATAEREKKIGPHAAAGLRLALFTGARSGEITAIRWCQIDWQQKLIRLPDSKTNEPRTIHLSDAAIEVLKILPRAGPYVVAGAKPGEPYRNLGRAWIVARAYAGLQDCRLHDLRHSYASLAAGRGVSLPMIGKLLGHRVAATTQRYAHLARDAVAAVNDDLGAAMVAAIEKKSVAPAKVVKFRMRK